ncbi:MAG: hypothetical protein IIA41_06220, partial [SAR324 cluster bacterium]|nr:hypothetical protein [SAR324 cluster bacterium]
MTTTQRTKSGRRAAHRAAPVLALTLALTLAVSLLAGCDPEPEVTTQDQCDELLDKGFWDAAITTCSQIMTDEGYSKTAQAYMGRAGITVLDLIRKIESNANLAGLALILNAFTVTPAEFADVEQAIAFMQLIVNFTNTDYFNIIVASDVALATLLKNELLITIDATTGAMTIPGITDSGLDTLSSTSTPAQIQTALDGIYGDPALDDTYYATPPPVWNNPGDVTDLSRVSSFVQANAIGSTAIALGALTDLDFAGQIDNGECGMPAAATASGFTLAHGTLVVEKFPRRLNTSDPTAAELADELHFVLLDGAG